jgi:hypothetical protein
LDARAAATRHARRAYIDRHAEHIDRVNDVEGAFFSKLLEDSNL